MTAEPELYAALDLVTVHAAAAMGLAPPSLAVGATADLVVLDTTRVIDAVVDPPRRLATFKGGRIGRR